MNTNRWLKINRIATIGGRKCCREVFIPDGVQAISRWLSTATPPVSIVTLGRHPEGMPAPHFIFAFIRVHSRFQFLQTTTFVRPAFQPDLTSTLIRCIGAIDGSLNNVPFRRKLSRTGFKPLAGG